MSMERARRDRFATNRVPLTWETPAAVVAAGVILILATPMLVQGLIAILITGEFAWPSQHLLDGYSGLLHGDFGKGLHRHAASALPPNPAMWLLTIGAEVLLLGAAVALVRWAREATGANTRHGLATAAQADQALGLPRLRKSAAVIRPDLYARTIAAAWPLRFRRADMRPDGRERARRGGGRSWQPGSRT